MKNQLHQEFYQKFQKELLKENNYSSIMAVPRLNKIVVSMCVHQAVTDKKALIDAMHELHLITGQKPVITRAKKSIAGFKLRTGMGLGCKVTLRGVIMYSFLHRLNNIVFPRIRDFQGFNKKAFDGQANYNLGIKEEIIFSEIDYDKIKINKGMNVTFVTSTNDSEASLKLLKKLGVPIRK